MNSLWPPARATLDDSLALPCETLTKLEAAQAVDIAEVIAQLEKAAESGRDLRALVSSELPDASWQNREELDACLEQIGKNVEARNIEQLRSRLLALATELESGSIAHRRAVRVEQVNQLRDQAINELRTQAGVEGTPPTLPGPEANRWVEWACGLKEPEDADSLETLRNRFAHLDDFIANLEPDMWVSKTVPEAPWPDREEVDALIGEVKKSLEGNGFEELRSRLSALADELERGRIVHHRVLRVNQLSYLRDLAVKELRSQVGSKKTPQGLPGPEAHQWVEWACGLKEPEDAESLQALRNGFAHLDEFVGNLEPDMWVAAGSPTVETPEEPAAPPNQVTPPSTEEQVQGMPAQWRTPPVTKRRFDHRIEPISTAEVYRETSAAPAIAEQPVEPPFTAEVYPETSAAQEVTDHPVEPPFTSEVYRKTGTAQAIISGVRTKVEELWRGKQRIPLLLVIAAVLVLAVLGALLWRSHRNRVRNQPAPAIQSQVPEATPSNPGSKDLAQPAMAADLIAKAPTDKQAKPKDQTVAAPTAAPPAKPAGKPEEAVLSLPAPVPKNTAAVKTEDRPPDSAADVSGSVPGGTANSVIGVARDIPVAQPKVAGQQIKVSSGVAQGLLIRQVAPRYPAQARQARIQGTVVLQAVIGKDGSVQNVHALRGPLPLIQSAVDAVKQWRYKPYTLDGEPVQAETQISVKFTL
jgi:periplasmic protein TonB